MSTESPVASDRTLDRAMTRAQGARRTRKSSLLWRSSAPRAGRKSIAALVTGVLAMAGMTGVAVVGATAEGGAVAPLVDSGVDELQCGPGQIVVDVDLGELAQVCVVVFPDPNGVAECPDGLVELDVDLDPLTILCTTALLGDNNLIDLDLPPEGGPLSGLTGGGGPLSGLTGGGGGGGLGGITAPLKNLLGGLFG